MLRQEPWQENSLEQMGNTVLQKTSVCMQYNTSVISKVGLQLKLNCI